MINIKSYHWIITLISSIQYLIKQCFKNHLTFTLARKTIFDGPQMDPNYQPFPEDRPGGFQWGGREEVFDDDD